MGKIIVARESGDYKTVAEAFAASKPGDTIYIKNGIYKEKLCLTTENVTIEGESREGVILTYDDYAKKLDEEGNPLRTSRTASLQIMADYVTLKNITVKNSSGNGRDFGQAIALQVEGDFFRCLDCSMIACQDTLFVGPFTQKEPCEPQTRKCYFGNCYIEGDIDFIFGGGTAFFEGCHIFSRNNITEEDIYFETAHTKGYVTAACTWEGVPYGFVFENCKFDSDCEEQTVYLGRPWRIHAKTVLIHCELGAHIKAEGFHDWGKPESHDTAYYGEYGSFGPGAMGKREEWVHILDAKEAAFYGKNKVLEGMEGIGE